MLIDVDLFVALSASRPLGIASCVPCFAAAVARTHRAATLFRFFFLQRCLCRVRKCVGDGSVVAARDCDGEFFVERQRRRCLGALWIVSVLWRQKGTAMYLYSSMAAFVIGNVDVGVCEQSRRTRRSVKKARHSPL